MSLLIKGMDMPTYEQGDIVLRVRWDGRVDKDNSGNTVATAIPVPPLGRLIDAGSFIKSVKSIEAEPDYQHDGEDWRVGLIIAESLAYEQPTIIPAEEGET